MSKEIKLKCGRVVPSDVKSSLLDEIVYFKDVDLKNIGEGYVKGSLDLISDIPMFTDIRYFLENDYTKRHPIPYALLRYKDKYFLADRLKGGTETRLNGKKGMLGGHVDKLDVITYGEENKVDLFENALLRELMEEVGVDKSIIDSITFKGYIRIVDETAVEGVHLALVYVVDLNTECISSKEEHILKGSWYTKEDIKDVYNTLEKWSELVIKNEVIDEV